MTDDEIKQHFPALAAQLEHLEESLHGEIQALAARVAAIEQRERQAAQARANLAAPSKPATEPAKVDKGGTFSVVYDFDCSAGTGCIPQGALLLDRAGHIYGTTYQGGARQTGLVYKITQ